MSQDFKQNNEKQTEAEIEYEKNLESTESAGEEMSEEKEDAHEAKILKNQMAASMGFDIPQKEQTEEEQTSSMKWVIALLGAAIVIAVLKSLFF